MTKSFQYTDTLGPASIRLLHLQPGKQGELIKITITTIKLAGTYDYEALSYEWGSSDKTAPISCEGKELMVTPSLSQALTHLRLPTSSRTLWVDAICINQNDRAERSQQVLLMRRIYSKAQCVLMWLGPAEPRNEDAFQMLPTLARLYMQRQSERSRAGLDLRYPWEHPSEQESSETRITDEGLWEAIYGLFSRTYFQRTWILQEIAVSRIAKVLCGEQSISWEYFSLAAGYSTSCLFHLQESPSERGLALITNISQYRLLCRYSGPIELESLCFHGLLTDTAQEQDKVYGIIGLLSPAKNPAYDVLLTVDYSLPAEVVYYRAAQWSIRKRKDLRICHQQCFLPKRSRDLPSWVPDWSEVVKEAPTITCPEHNRVEFPIVDDLEFDAGSLRVFGCVVDEICYVTDELTSEHPLPAIEQIIVFLALGNKNNQSQQDRTSISRVDELEHCNKSLKDRIYRQSGETLYEALWRALIANTSEGAQAKSGFGDYFDALIDNLRLRARGVTWEKFRFRDKEKMDESSRLRLRADGEAQRLWATCEDGAVRARKYYIQLTHSFPKRRFFITKTGYMGISSLITEKGDQIVLLRGGWLPFVLRRQETSWRMVGDAYVHGLRDKRSCELYLNRIQRFEIR